MIKIINTWSMKDVLEEKSSLNCFDIYESGLYHYLIIRSRN